jgi:exodeoxyribonuclease-3
MKVVTWNVNSLKQRMPRVLEFLELHEPDVVCLQETKSPVDGFPAEELRATGYDSMHNSAGQWAGVALLARAPLELSEPSCGLPGDTVAEEARWCEATIGGIRFASTYVPNGRTLDSPEYPRKLAFLEAMAGLAAAPSEHPRIIAGDMNIAPADIDVYDPPAFVGGTHVSEPERALLARILESGYVDAYRHVHPDEQQFTWWDYRAGHFHKGLGLRIDLMLVSSALGSELRACGIDRNFRKGTKPSDHAPLLLDMDIA